MNTRPIHAFDVRVARDNNGVMVVRGTEAYELEGVALDIWNLCDGAHTVTEIADKILAGYEVDEAGAKADTEKFLMQLRRAGLVE